MKQQENIIVLLQNNRFLVAGDTGNTLEALKIAGGRLPDLLVIVVSMNNGQKGTFIDGFKLAQLAGENKLGLSGINNFRQIY